MSRNRGKSQPQYSSHRDYQMANDKGFGVTKTSDSDKWNQIHNPPTIKDDENNDLVGFWGDDNDD